MLREARWICEQLPTDMSATELVIDSLLQVLEDENILEERRAAVVTIVFQDLVTAILRLL